MVQYSINGDNKCPRCGIGVIIPDWRSKVCLCCGLRSEDVVTLTDMVKDATIFWLVRNKPNEVAPEFSIGSVI